MLKDDYIQELNNFLSETAESTRPIFSDGSEEQIMLLLEKWKRAYAYLREEASKTAKARNLKRLKEQGIPSHKPGTLLERLPQAKRGKPKPRTKEQQMKDSFAKLGIDGDALLKAMLAEREKGKKE